MVEVDGWDETKATLPFGNELLIERVIRLLSQIVPQRSIVCVAREGQPLPSLPPGVRLTTDRHPDCGPLEGLAAGLESLPETVECAYATSCDAPLLRTEFIEQMFAQLGDFDMAIPVETQFHHPLAAVYRRRILPAIERLLAEGRYRPAFLIDECDAREVPIDTLRGVDPDLESLINCNHPEDYEAALQRAGLPPT